MRDSTKSLIRDVIATISLTLLAALAMSEGYPLSSLSATMGIGVVNTLTISELYESFRRVQAQNRGDYTDDSRNP